MRAFLGFLFAGLLALSSPPSASAQSKPVKVFILAGQSNMQGHGIIAADPKRNGGKGSLEYLVKDAKTAERFKHLVNADGTWRKRDDVWVISDGRHGPLTVGYGANNKLIGPELGFGHVVGEAIDSPVLLVKCSWGGRSIAVDFRPPSAGKIPAEYGKGVAASIEKNPDVVGKAYRDTLSITRDALSKIKELVPGSDGRYELAGFAWHQGWNDRINEAFNKDYENNLAHFISDIRKELKAPNLPFVIAETGMTGPEEKNVRALALMRAQAAVAERPEFKGNVAFVGTKSLWRPKEESPSGQGYHWNTNAETYYLIGEGLGTAMLKLAKTR